jgi:DNA (cytosine-5)-methyltransferase 1
VKYFSVCSGIEAATVAWRPLDWKAVGFSEIDPFPAHVLHHHYGSGRPMFMPDPNAPGLTDETRKKRAAAIRAIAGLPEQASGVPNFGDLNQFKEWADVPDFDVLVGGTPCQSFSVSGLRQGLADPRGNLCLTLLAYADRCRPEWIIWENVPGVLSSLSHPAPDIGEPPPPVDMERDGQKVETQDYYDAEELCAFECFLSGLSELGYGYAYRVLDAQFVRVDGFARAVPQRRRRVFVVGNRIDASRAAAVLFEQKSLRGNSPPRREAREDTANRAQDGTGIDCGRDGLAIDGLDVGAATFGVKSNATSMIGRAYSTSCANRLLFVPQYSPAIKARDYKGVSSDGSGDGIPVIVEAFDKTGECGCDTADTFATFGERDPNGNGDVHKSTFLAWALCAYKQWAVRRLMPVECERLQGFPDNYTLVPVRGLPAADGPRYKALGNSMAVNVMRWLATRIMMVNRLTVGNETKCKTDC